MYIREVVSPSVGNRVGSAGFGSFAVTPRDEAEAARMRQAIESMNANVELTVRKYGPGFIKLAEMGQAMDSGDPTRIGRAIADATATVASMFGPVGAVIGGVLRVLQGAALWLAQEFPAVQIDCFSRGRHLKHACRLLRGSDSDADMAAVYRDEGRFWLGTTKVRSSTRKAHRLARNSENLPLWSDPPMVPARGKKEGDVFYHDLVDLEGSNVEELKSRLIEFCVPVRRFVTPTPPASSGYRTWSEYLVAHPDMGGSKAAMQAGAEVYRKLVQDGDPIYVAGSDGDYCWHGGFLVKCSGFTDATLVTLLRLLAESQSDSAEVAEAKKIVAGDPFEPNNLMYWIDGLALSVFHFVRTSPYGTYHLRALLNEYSRRALGGTTVSKKLVSRAVRASKPTFRPVAVLPEAWKPKTEEEEKSWWKTPWPWVGLAAVTGIGYLIYRARKE